jgi:MFS family permease
MFVVPGIVAIVFEPPLFLLADRHPRRWFLRGGVGAMAAGALVCAVSTGPAMFAIGMSIGAVATGTATGLAQATLVDRWPDERGRTLARWSMWSLAGDFVAPALLAGLALAGLGWRLAFAIVAGVLAVVCALLCATSIEDERATPPNEANDASTTDALGLLASLREALRDRLLVAWLFGCALCDLLDEIFVVFASIHLRSVLGAGPLWQSAVIGAFMVGAAGGLAAVDRLLRVRGERWLLVAASLATIVSFVPFVLAPSPLAALVLAIPVGFSSAPLYPLAAAQAYATRPAQSGSVLAAAHLFTPLGLALPWLIGVVADHAGTTVALALLVVQPIGLIALVAASRAAGIPRQNDVASVRRP